MEAQSQAAAPSANVDSPPSANTTLADQLRSRLEERRKSKEEEQQVPQTAATSGPFMATSGSQPHMASVVASNSASTQSAAYVPESIAADIQKAVKMANDTSKF